MAKIVLSVRTLVRTTITSAENTTYASIDDIFSR